MKRLTQLKPPNGTLSVLALLLAVSAVFMLTSPAWGILAIAVALVVLEWLLS